MNVAIGIDYSMTCPAVCAYSPESCKFWFAHETKYDNIYPDAITAVPITPSSVSVSRRAADHARKVTRWLEENFPLVRQIDIEDYAYSASGRVFHIGEHTGILKHYLDNLLIDIHPVPPTVVKKFATGKGNADKPKMTAAFLAAYPAAEAWIPLMFPRSKKTATPAKSPLADLADAYWIARHSFETGLTVTA